jgi:hypothetical protein
MSASEAQVPKQLYGYSLQFTECVNSLLDSPSGSLASVEVFEDVGIQTSSSETEAIQVKAGSGKNPVSDGALDLWKTFRNWIDQCNNLQLNPIKTQFRIHVNSKHKGKLCSLLSEATSSAEIKKASDTVSKSFIDGRTKTLKESLGAGITEQMKIVLDPLNQELFRLIIANFRHTSASSGAYEGLLRRFRTFPIKEGVIEGAMLYIVGWTKMQIDVALEKDLPAIVHRDDFWNALTTYVEKATQQPYLIRYAHEPTSDADSFSWHRPGQDDVSPRGTGRSGQGARKEEVHADAAANFHGEHADVPDRPGGMFRCSLFRPSAASTRP